MADAPAKTAILARLVAERLHDGQLRKDGEAYFRHCERVAARVMNLGSHARAVGYLHDVLEDTKIGLVALTLLFGPEIAGDVATVTKWRASYDDYVETVARGSDVALAVKLADLAENLPNAPESLAERYRRAQARLLAEAARRGMDEARYPRLVHPPVAG